jgi:hypothetical protein
MEIQMKVFYRGNYRKEASVSFHGVSFSKGAATAVDPKWYELHKCEKLEVDIAKPKAKPKADKK